MLMGAMKPEFLVAEIWNYGALVLSIDREADDVFEGSVVFG